MELFPTAARVFGFSACFMMGRIGGIVAPFLRDLVSAMVRELFSSMAIDWRRDELRFFMIWGQAMRGFWRQQRWTCYQVWRLLQNGYLQNLRYASTFIQTPSPPVPNLTPGIHPACTGVTWGSLLTSFFSWKYIMKNWRNAREVPAIVAAGGDKNKWNNKSDRQSHNTMWQRRSIHSPFFVSIIWEQLSLLIVPTISECHAIAYKCFPWIMSTGLLARVHYSYTPSPWFLPNRIKMTLASFWNVDIYLLNFFLGQAKIFALNFSWLCLEINYILSSAIQHKWKIKKVILSPSAAKPTLLNVYWLIFVLLGFQRYDCSHTGVPVRVHWTQWSGRFR